jgi:hypothetical protein
MWTLWIAHNHFVFNQVLWNHQYVASLIWQSILEYAKAAWAKALWSLNNQPAHRAKILANFDAQWGRFSLICSHVELKVTWMADIPDIGIT